MKERRLTIRLIFLIVIFIALMTTCCNDTYVAPGEISPWKPSVDAEEQAFKLWQLRQRDYLIDIQDPDGTKHTWVISPFAFDKIDSILSNYTQKTVDGISQYKVTSWKDMSKMAETVNEDRDDLTPNYVPTLIRESSTFFILQSGRRSVAEPGGLQLAAKTAGVI